VRQEWFKREIDYIFIINRNKWYSAEKLCLVDCAAGRGLLREIR
jgi:hypothetical protein